MTLYDFNSSRTRRDHFSEVMNLVVDEGIARDAENEKPRTYLGASQIGDECQRRVQYEITGAPGEPFTARTRRIFTRGHSGEELVIQWLRAGGFDISGTTKEGRQHGFAVADGKLRGHVDGVILSATHAIDGLEFPALWENKVLGAKGWKSVAKDGVAKAYPKYADQIALYQAYMDLTAPALFTALNADTMEIWYELVPFDAVRAQAASDRAVLILQSTAAGELLPRVAGDAESFPCRFCRFAAHCWSDGR